VPKDASLKINSAGLQRLLSGYLEQTERCPETPRRP
jgi:hypothetical protein